jgi:preprotein translocase subunit YajC
VHNYLPLLLAAALVALFLLYTRRIRQRQSSAQAARDAAIAPGTAVMTTSGLYATVVAVNDDGTAVLSIAPGVEVRWAVAALRQAAELPHRYGQGFESDQPPDRPEPGTGETDPRGE